MSDQKPEPSSDILRGMAKEHEDLPGDLARTEIGGDTSNDKIPAGDATS